MAPRRQLRQGNSRYRRKFSRAPGKNRDRATTSLSRRKKAAPRARSRGRTAWRWKWAPSYSSSTSRVENLFRRDPPGGAFDAGRSRVEHQRPLSGGIGAGIIDARDAGRFENRFVNHGTGDLQWIGRHERRARVVLERILNSAKGGHENGQGKTIGDARLPREPRRDAAAERIFFLGLEAQAGRDGI